MFYPISTLINLLLITLSYGEGAKILSLFAMPSGSHVIFGYELSTELARRGHEVLMITPYPRFKKINNFTEIYLKDLSEAISRERNNYYKMNEMYTLIQIIYCYHLGYTVMNGTYNDPQIQELLKSNRTFDLVLMDQFYSESLLGIAHHFKAPVILSSSLETPTWTHHIVRNPDYYSYIPNVWLPSPFRMNFLQRVRNTLINVGETLYRELVAYPYYNEILHKYLPEAPHVTDLIYNVSLILVNSHFSTHMPSPKVPNMIEIAGMHVKTKNELTDDVKEFLDNAKDGAIYFSMGSNLKGSFMPDEIRSAFIRIFSRVKVKVLWIYDLDDLPGRPDNVMITKWVSQVDVLAHPNVKAFISHGGLMSVVEAVYFGVPIFGVPVYADQKMNIAHAVAQGSAVGIEFEDLSEEKMTWALNEILNNPKYRINMKKRSDIMHDRPLKPMDTAVYWVEYVLRYNGAPQLRTAAMELTWYQIHLLDVIAFILIGFICSIYLVYCIIKFLFIKSTNDKRKIE